MNELYEHNLLLESLNRIPDRYTLYALPDDKRGGPEYSRIGITLESGEVFLFEFDFCVEAIPLSKIDDLAFFGCSTCADRNPSCPLPPEKQGNGCELWVVSSHAVKIAEVEYYKQLHKKYYGNDCLIGSRK